MKHPTNRHEKSTNPYADMVNNQNFHTKKISKFPTINIVTTSTQPQLNSKVGCDMKLLLTRFQQNFKVRFLGWTTTTKITTTTATLTTTLTTTTSTTTTTTISHFSMTQFLPNFKGRFLESTTITTTATTLKTTTKIQTLQTKQQNQQKQWTTTLLTWFWPNFKDKK